MIPFDSDGCFHPIAEGSELRRLAVRGAAATVSAAALALAAQIVSTVIMARLLAPADFGLLAMVTTVSMLLESFGLNGFQEVVIQQDGLDHYQASNLFWINCALALVFSIGFAAAGSLVARFFRNPLVTRVALGIAPTIFVAAISVIHTALLKRGMRFGAVSVNEIAGRVVCAVVGILLALMGWGYWALVGAFVAQRLSLTVGAFWLCRWIPGLPRRRVGTRAMLRFAAHVYSRFSANYFARNFDNILVGWRFNAAALGFYKKAYDLFALSASQLTSPVANVALAALSRVTDDRERFNRYLANSLGIIALIGMGVSADVTLVGRELVRLVLGPKWEESGRIFEFFGPGVGVMLLSSTVGWIHLSIGKPERWFRWTLVESGACAFMFLLALPWGPAGIAVAWTVSFWLLAVPAFWYAGRPIKLHVSSVIGAVWKYILGALIAGVGCGLMTSGLVNVSAATSGASVLKLIIAKSLLFTVLYLGMIILLYQDCEPLYRVARLVREILPGASFRTKSSSPSTASSAGA